MAEVRLRKEMTDIRYVIQAVPGRQKWVKELQDRLGGCRSFVYYDMCRQPVKAFIGSLLVVDNDSGHVHLEDDAMLCSRFEVQVEEAVEQYEDSVINFFAGLSKKREMKPMEVPGRKYLMAQCTWFPKWFPMEFAQWFQENRQAVLEAAWSGMDTLVAEFLKATGRKYVHWWPSLVQHRPGVSMIDSKRSKFRQTNHFADDLAVKV